MKNYFLIEDDAGANYIICEDCVKMEHNIKQVLNDCNLECNNCDTKPNQITVSNLPSESWAEDHYQIVAFIELNLDSYEKLIEFQRKHGSAYIMSWAFTLTNEFQAIHKDTVWGESKVYWQDAIEDFIDSKLNN